MFLPSAPLFFPFLTSLFLAELSGNIIPPKQPPLAAALKNFCMLNCLLAAQFKEYQKFRSYCCFKQIILAFMFENLIKNQLLSGQCESAILCLQQCEGIIRGQKLEFSNGSLSGMRGGAVDNSPVCSLLSTELASCRQQNLKKKKHKPYEQTCAILHTNHLTLGLIHWCVSFVPYRFPRSTSRYRETIYPRQSQILWCYHAKIIGGWQRQGQWSKLHGCIGQSSVMTACPQS